MRQIRQTLRLHLDAGLSLREISRVLGISKSVANNYVRMARLVGVDWATAQSLSDAALEARLFMPPGPRAGRLEPDFALIHQELKRPGVTLQLLWEEYHRGRLDTYKYTSFCLKYRAWAAGLKRSMRQIHLAGERLFVDYAGHTMPLVNDATGEISRAQIFVAVLGASNYTYACATATQTAVDWVDSIIDALEFIGGVPKLIVPDQPRALIAQPDRYEPGLGRLAEEFASHYDVAVLPARPAHPRDKPKVEVGVQIVERWILARLRNRTFFGLADLNHAIGNLLTDLNHRPFKKLPGCRRDAFLVLDRPALRDLPASRLQIARFKQARVNIDYHIELDGHYYSVPHRFVGNQMDLRITANTVEILLRRQRVAIHPISTRKGHHSTLDEHMPALHRAHRNWTPAKLIGWGERVGAATGALIAWQMENRKHPEQGYRSCLGLLRLARRYGDARLDAACARATAIGSPHYRSVNAILVKGLDQQPLPTTPSTTAMPVHENVRGPDYYH